ncbi:MAG: hypothetical protein K2P51_03065 [Rhabdochlamydiaceae bacterium]|nr:hypothetical protein [Rhabdochlamydiaceae bacterium]
MAATSSSIPSPSPYDLPSILGNLRSHQQRLSGSGEACIFNETEISAKINALIHSDKTLLSYNPYYRSSTSGLARTIYVVPAGVFMLLTRKSKGDLMTAGGIKRTYTAINLSTNKFATYFSCKEKKIEKDTVASCLTSQFRGEFLLQAHMGSDITASTFSDSSTIHHKKGVAHFCYLGEKMEGDLFQGILSGRIDVKDTQTRFNLLHQIADVTARFQTKAKEMFGKECVHRDLKPDNYLYDFKNGELVIRLIDFERISPSGIRSLVSGTPQYIDPYIFRNADSGFYAAAPFNDSWSLGMTLVQIIYSRDAINFLWLTSNSNFYSILIRSQYREIIDDILDCETQEEWIPVAPSRDSIEYVIYMLLQLDPKKRWTIQQAADELLRLKQLLPEVSTKATGATAESLPLTP